MSERGLFATIEGGDGSGKGTQAERLRQHLHANLGRTVVKFSYPQYGEDSALFVEEYLNGKYGEANDVHPDLASAVYMLDRVVGARKITEARERGEDTVLDRYVWSNAAHQGTKIHDRNERRAFYDRIVNYEFDVLGLPRPDHNVVLLVPSAVAQTNVDKKDARSYTTKKRDIHEADANHLDLAKANYEELCELYPGELTAIDCMDMEGRQRSIEDIQTEIQSILGV